MASNREHTESIASGNTSTRRRRIVDGDAADQRIHDIVCIGFGCNAISLAVALKEVCDDADILFLDSQPRSTYVPFNRLPGSFMQLSFLNDIVTLENPRSKFSFVNYLHSTDQLIQFTNLGATQPLREQFSRYLTWCADQFKSKVQYGSEVQAVRPARIYGSSVDAWSVEYIDVETGILRKTLAKQVVCAGGSRKSMPPVLSDPDIHTSVSHSSNCSDLLTSLSRDLSSQYHIAVVGDGQEAAEIVEKICSMRNSHQITWIQEPSTNGAGGVDHALSERLYERQYSQRIHESDPQRWTFQTHTTVGLRLAYRGADGRLRLSYTGFDPESGSAGIVCDFVIAATGYEELGYKQLLDPVRELLHGDKFTVNRHRGVNLKAELVEQSCGIWMLGSNQQGDESLAQMATTSRYLTDSLVKKLRGRPSNRQPMQPRL